VLEKVIAYCEHHVNDPKDEMDTKEDEMDSKGEDEKMEEKGKKKDISEWDRNLCNIVRKGYISDMDRASLDQLKLATADLFELIKAANYLDVKGLLDVTCVVAADLIRGHTEEEIRSIIPIE